MGLFASISALLQHCKLSSTSTEQLDNEGAAHHGKLSRRHYLIVLIFASLLYLNGLFGDFAYDDSRAIKSNQDIVSSTSWYNVLQNDFWGTPIRSSNSHGSYRPVATISFRFNFALHGLDPFGFHLFNLLLHTTVTFLYMRFISYALNSHKRITLISSLLFASHPIHVESVTNIVGRADVGAAFFYLLALLSYAKFVKLEHNCEPIVLSHGRKYLYASLAFAALSMFTKEHGVTCLAVCAVYHLFVVHRFFPFSLSNYRVLLKEPYFLRLRRGLVHLSATALLLVVVRFLIMASTPTFATADNPASTNSSVIIRFLTFLYLPAFNFWLLTYPRWLSFDWSMDSIPLIVSIFDHRNLHSFLFYTALFTLLRKMVKFYLAQFGSFLSENTLVEDKSCFRCEQLIGFSSQKHVRSKVIYDDNNNSSSAVNYNYPSGEGSVHLDWPLLDNAWLDANNNDQSMPNRNSGLISDNMHPSAPAKPPLLAPPNQPFSRVLCRLDCLALSLALMIIPFLPASNLFFYVGFVVAERILYIPSFGYCLFLAICIESMIKLCQKSHFLKMFIYLSLALLIVTFSIRTVLRNMDWQSEESLYRSGIEINPAKACGNLANILIFQGKTEEAEFFYRKALKKRPNMADVHYNLGLLLQEQARHEEAVESYSNAIRFRPRLAIAHLNLAIVLTHLNQTDRAKHVYRHCAQIDGTGLKDVKLHESTKISALYNLGRIYADEDNFAVALQIFQEAVSRMPPYYPAQSLFNVLGEMYFQLNQYKEAELWFRKSLKVKRDHIPAHLTLAKLLTKLNRTTEAEQIYLNAMTIGTNDSVIYHHFGQFMSNLGKFEYALEIFEKGLEIAPGNFDLIMGTAHTLRELRRSEHAEQYYKMAVEIRPDEVIGHSNLGAIYHLNGKYQLAMESYLHVLKLRPEDATTRINLAKLKQVMATRHS